MRRLLGGTPNEAPSDDEGLALALPPLHYFYTAV